MDGPGAFGCVVVVLVTAYLAGASGLLAWAVLH